MFNDREVVIECDRCYEIIPLKDTLVKDKRFKINDKIIYVTYFKCLKCNETYIISIDDDVQLRDKQIYVEKVLQLTKESFNVEYKRKQIKRLKQSIYLRNKYLINRYTKSVLHQLKADIDK